MADLKFEVIGDRLAVARLTRLPGEVRAALVKATGRIVLKLMRQSVQQKLSGQVLKRVTGTLARSVTQSPRTYEAGPNIIGTVGVNDIKGPGGRAPVAYGRAQEYGFKGTVTVKEHLRRHREASKVQLFKTSASKDFGVYRTVRGKLTGGTSIVRSHTRQVDLPARSFLRSALADLNKAGVIEAEFQEAVDAAVKGR